MANVYSGIYTKLKDRNCGIKDRLKLAKFAWFSDKVIFPNKEQVLIDFLSGLLLNKKRSNLSENETDLVWRCLYEVLQSKKCHIPGKSRQTLIIKPSICQVLCSSILLEYEQKSGCVGDIVGCALAIIRSPTLSYVFTSKYEFLVKFLRNVLLLIIRTIQDDQVVPPEYVQLLQKCISAYSVSQRAQPQQEKVFQSVVDCLLVPIILLENDADQKCPELKDCTAKLGNALDQALFHKEHHPFYESFLSTVVGKDEAKHKVSKTIDNLFKLLSSLLNKQKVQDCSRDPKTIASHYLTVFYEHFLSYKCHGEKPLTGFRLFVHICSLLGVSDTELGELRLSGEDVVAVVSSLLTSVLKHDIYSQPQDATEGGVQLKFYSHILVVIMQHKQSSFFYSCLESLLELNHVIIETKMAALLQNAWFGVPSKEHLAESRPQPLESFVSRLFQTYSRLRQIPKLLALLFTSLREFQQSGESPSHQSPVLSDRVSLEFGEIVESLPQVVAVDIWRLFLKEIEDYMPELGHKVQKFLFVAKLFSVYLSHVRVADYTVTHLTRSKVKDLMADTQSKVLTPLVEFIVTDKVDVGESLVFSALLLCFTWGELHLLLEEFVPNNERSQCHDPNLYRNLEAIFTISSKTWKKLHTLATTRGHKKNCYLWKLLTTLILKAVLADKEMEVGDNECVGKIVERLVADIHKISYAEESLVPQMFWDISDENYSLASLDLVMRVIPLCGSLVVPGTTQQITNLVVQVIGSEEAKEGCSVQNHLLRKCSTSALLESVNWTACMMSSAFQSLRSKFPKKQKNPHKKLKPDSSTWVFEALLDIACDSVFIKGDSSLQTEKLRDLSNLFNNSFLDINKKGVHLGVNASTLMACVQVIEMLVPADHAPNEKIRGFLGMFALLTLEVSQEDGEGMVDRIVTLLISIVERLGQTPLFHSVNMDSYINWLDCIIASKKKLGFGKLVHKLELLLELTCRVMVTEFQLLPELLRATTKALQNSNTVPCSVVVSLREISQLLKRPYVKEEVINLCQTGVLQLFHHLRSHLNLAKTTTRTFSASHLQALSAVVDILPADQLQQGMVQNVCDFCLEVLENSKGDCRLTSASLGYLETVCLCQDTEKDLLTSEIKLTLWRTLKKVFYDFFVCDKQTPSQRKESNSGHNSVCNANGKQNMKEVDYFREDPVVLSWQDGGKEHSWNWMRKKMIYEGCLERDGRKLIFKQVQSTIGALIFSLDANLFQTVIKTLLSDCSLKELAEDDFYRMLASLRLWSQVIQNELSEEKGAVVVQAVEEVMVNFQSAMIQLKDIRDVKVTIHLMLPLLNCQTEMLNFGPSLMSSQCAAMALQSCGWIPSCTLSNFPAFQAVCAVLTSLMVHHTETVLKVIPTFISCVNRLMSSIISFGNQETLSDPDSVIDAKQCAHLLHKLCALIASHKQEFSKVAVYMTANYVTEVQRVTLHPVVKRALLPAVYSILDICDTHAVSQLHVVLSQGVKEVFKMLYADYLKYHHYTGKLLKRPYVKVEVINLCQTGVLQLFHHLRSHLNLAKTTTRTFSASHLQALSAVVDILPADQLQLGMVQNVCDFCSEVLENSKGDCRLTSASLGYLETVCLCRDTEKDLLTPEIKLTLWRTLKKVFYDFFVCDKQTPIQRKESNFGHNSVCNADRKQNMKEVDYFREDPVVLSWQDGGKEHSWNWMRKKMIYEGCLERDGRKLIFRQVQSTIGALIFSLDANLFQTVIKTLLSDCSLKELAEDDFYRMLASLHLWSQVIQNELSEEKGAVVVQAVEEVMVNFQSAMIQLKDIRDVKVTIHLMLPLLNCQTEMLNFGPSLMSSQCAAMALQSCGWIPSCTLSNFPAFQAVCAVLTSLMVHHTETVLKVIPTFISCVNRLMSSIISFGNQETLSDPDSVSDAKQCAHLLHKLCALIASHKQELSKVAVYMTANYVTEVQRVTLHPVVKRALLPAVYSILDICDTHAVSQLHVVLNQGVKEVFKMLYADYLKYHHYTGKV